MWEAIAQFAGIIFLWLAIYLIPIIAILVGIAGIVAIIKKLWKKVNNQRWGTNRLLVSCLFLVNKIVSLMRGLNRIKKGDYMIKGIIFAYVVIAMIYYLLTVVLLCSTTIRNSIVGIMPMFGNSDTINDISDSIMKICKNNSVIYFIVISICGLIGGFGLPIMLLIQIIKS